ncbi:MAG: class I SAM-dependent methyltransferase [Desulfobacteraceae bacterium]|nr:class I SAM-dependent methyltransferase [Desulfobacteraceae bacterium]
MPTSKTDIFNAVNISTVRSYWDERPCNIRHSEREIGTKAYFDEVEKRKYFVEPHIRSFADFRKWKGKKVLEIGCGIGTDTINFARAGAQVTAVDLSEESLKVARQRARVFGLADRIRFYRANAEELSNTVPVENYDLVYSFGVIHHTPHPQRAISQIRRYLGPDSQFKLMVYHRHSWKVFWIIATYGKCAFWNADALIARHSEAQTGCPVTYSYTRGSVRKLLAGLEITDSRVDHIFSWSIPEYIRYQFKKVWYFRWMPTTLFRHMEQRWGWHLCVTAKNC